MLRTLRILAAGCLALSGAPVSATTADLCDRLFVPEGYRLTCTVEGGGSEAPRLVVRPESGTFASLSELEVREVGEPIDDPAAWLREQLTLDMSSFDAAIDELLHGEDSPIADSPLVDQLDGWRRALHAVGDWPLSGCEPPAEVAGEEWRMDCAWQLGPLHQYMALRLVERDGRRYVIQVRAMNERRLRHLVAIANSF